MYEEYKITFVQDHSADIAKALVFLCVLGGFKLYSMGITVEEFMMYVLAGFLGLIGLFIAGRVLFRAIVNKCIY